VPQLDDRFDSGVVYVRSWPEADKDGTACWSVRGDAKRVGREV